MCVCVWRVRTCVWGGGGGGRRGGEGVSCEFRSNRADRTRHRRILIGRTAIFPPSHPPLPRTPHPAPISPLHTPSPIGLMFKNEDTGNYDSAVCLGKETRHTNTHTHTRVHARELLTRDHAGTCTLVRIATEKKKKLHKLYRAGVLTRNIEGKNRA